MRTRYARKTRVLVFLVLFLGASIWSSGRNAMADDTLPIHSEFSGTIFKQVNAKKYQAQVFAKGDRLRLEYKYAIRTDVGYAAIEIIRLDRSEVWYLLAQQKVLLVVPLDPDEVLPMRPELPGERSRIVVGPATVAGRAAQLFEIQTDRRGRTERFYEWVDAETGIVLRLVNRDRDWSFEYARIRLSPQPSYYFDEPPGYMKPMSATGSKARRIASS